MRGLFPWCPSPALLSPGSSFLESGVRTLSPCPHPPGLSLQTVAGAAGLCPRGDGTETCRCSRATRGWCQCTVCNRFPWGPCRGLLLPPGRTSIFPCSGTIRGHCGMGVVSLSLAPGRAHPCHHLRHHGIWPHVKVGWPRASAGGGGHWSGGEVRPGQRPQLALIRCASPSRSGA